MVTRDEAAKIMKDFDDPVEARKYAAEIMAIWETPMVE